MQSVNSKVHRFLPPLLDLHECIGEVSRRLSFHGVAIFYHLHARGMCDWAWNRLRAGGERAREREGKAIEKSERETTGYEPFDRCWTAARCRVLLTFLVISCGFLVVLFAAGGWLKARVLCINLTISLTPGADVV